MDTISFVEGESVEILGTEYDGLFTPIDNDGIIPDDAIWREAEVGASWGDSLSIRYRRREGGGINYSWRVYDYEYARLLRRPGPQVPMAESCVECKTQFPYPNEHNCSEGRVCFSCRSTYGWKYKFFGDKS